MDLLKMQRLGRRLHNIGVPFLPALLLRLMRFLYQAHLPYTTQVGEGTRFSYNGMGCFIHRSARIGRHCLISPFVIIGGRQAKHGGARIGDYVRIGAGAKLLGPVRIGDFAVVGANAVVTQDVPGGAVVGGVPARELRRMEDPVTEYERGTGQPVPLLDRQRAPRPESAVEVLQAPAGGGHNLIAPEPEQESGSLAG